MARTHHIRRYFLTGLFVLVPAWATFLVLRTLFVTLDGLVKDLLGPVVIERLKAWLGPAVMVDVPGLGILTLLGLILLTGVTATYLFGQRLFDWMEARLQQIPLVRSVYATLKGMTDVFKFRERFGRSTVVVFPFPRRGLWALGFIMGAAPPALQIAYGNPLQMVFVPTAIHPFTGYLAFIPHTNLLPINLAPEEAMKLEFSAGLYRPPPGWLQRSASPSLPKRPGA